MTDAEPARRLALRRGGATRVRRVTVAYTAVAATLAAAFAALAAASFPGHASPAPAVDQGQIRQYIGGAPLIGTRPAITSSAAAANSGTGPLVVSGGS